MVILKGFVGSLTLNIESCLLRETQFCFPGCLLCHLYYAPHETHMFLFWRCRALITWKIFHLGLSLEIFTKISYIRNRPDRLPWMCCFNVLDFKKIKYTRKKEEKPPFGDRMLLMQLPCCSFIPTPASQEFQLSNPFCAWIIISILHFLDSVLVISACKVSLQL